MKKFLFILLVFSFTMCSALAEDMKVMALNDFSTAVPKEIQVKVIESVSLDKDVLIPMGSTVTGLMIDVIPAKRLKRDATFSFMPTYFTTPQHERYKFNKKYVGKFSPNIEIDKGELAKNAALTVGDFFVQGLSTGFYAVQGAVKDEKGNKLFSAVNNVYKNSFFSYVEKGGDVYIKAESLFCFKFKKPEENENNDNSTPAIIKMDEPKIENQVPGLDDDSLPATPQPQF